MNGFVWRKGFVPWLIFLIAIVSVIVNADAPKVKSCKTDPVSVCEAIDCLDEILDYARKEEIRSLSEPDLVLEHFALGGLVRNLWLYKRGSVLVENFERLGVHHPDNMSSIVVKAYWLHLQHREIAITSLVEEMLESIEASGNPFETLCPDDPREKLQLIVGDESVDANGRVTSGKLYAECPSTKSNWVFDIGDKRWRPATASERDRILSEKDRR